MSGSDARLGDRHPGCIARGDTGQGDMVTDVRLKVATSVTSDREHTLLTVVGFRWAKAHRAGDRDTPSRRAAYELASHALGRRPSERECIVIQRAARAAAVSG